MRPGDAWEVSVGKFSISGRETGSIRLKGPKENLTTSDLDDLLRVSKEAMRYAIVQHLMVVDPDASS